MDRNLGTNITNISFKNSHVVYENFIKCTVKDYEYNLSYNPTLLSGSQGVLTPYSSSDSGSIIYINTGSNSNYGILKNFLYKETTSNYSQSVFSNQTMFTGGTNVLPPYADDAMASGISIGFDFDFYGVTYNTCNLSSNGNLQFVTNDSEFQDGYSLPYTPFGPAILALWSDLVIGTSGYRADAGIYTQTIGIPGNRIFIADWRVNFYDDVYQANFQIRLYEGTNVIELVYDSISNPDSNYVTIGIQDGGSNVMDYYQDSINHLYPSIGTMIVYSPLSVYYDFSPYVTTVGLYNDAQELLAIGKMAAPMPLSANTDTTFLVKYDLNFTSEVIPVCKNYTVTKTTPTFVATFFSYTDCDKNRHRVQIDLAESVTFCAAVGSIDITTEGGDSLELIENGSC